MAVYRFLMECIANAQRAQSFVESQLAVVYQILREYHDLQKDENTTLREKQREIDANRFHGYNSIREILRHDTSEEDMRFHLKRGLKAAADGRIWTEQDLNFLDDMIAEGIHEYQQA